LHQGRGPVRCCARFVLRTSTDGPSSAWALGNICT
jgi:hypothetical protein